MTKGNGGKTLIILRRDIKICILYINGHQLFFCSFIKFLVILKFIHVSISINWLWQFNYELMNPIISIDKCYSKV